MAIIPTTTRPTKARKIARHSIKEEEAEPINTGEASIELLAAAASLEKTVSGQYLWTQTSGFLPQALASQAPSLTNAAVDALGSRPPHYPGAIAQPAPAAQALIFPFRHEVLRLDVDGRYPQMMASGTLTGHQSLHAQWIASMSKISETTYAGSIWYKDGGAAGLPYTRVEIAVANSGSAPGSAKVRFSGGGAAELVRVFKYKSSFFHSVEFEFDFVQGVAPVTDIRTHAHPNRPGDLADERLSIQTVFRRAGFYVRTSSRMTEIPLTGAGANASWSDAEMHDAMQTYWSRFADAPQWALWTFFASLHDEGESLGGIMFDEIGPNHRQGTAIFNNAFISKPPSGDPAPAAWVARMRFWTAVHEMGHAFNLAHSWQKSLGASWMPLPDEPEARSFMNYPYNVAGGQTSFFSDFGFRFSDSELLFMRHAPPRFVQMGNAAWFDNHGFREANTSLEPAFRLELRLNRPKPLFEFMEPVVVELKLTNISDQPQLVEENILGALEHFTVIIKKEGAAAREFIPFAKRCWRHKLRALEPGAAMYDSLFASVGSNGWDLAEPGNYCLQVAMHLPETDILSNQLRLRIAVPHSHDEEALAQDFFTEDVGRVLAFDGTRFLSGANDALRAVAEQLPNSKVALHAKVALGSAAAREFKELDLPDSQSPSRTTMPASEMGAKIRTHAPKTKEAESELNAALVENPEAAAESLGHIDFKCYVDRFSDYLAEHAAPKEAARIQGVLHAALTARKVLPRILDEVARRRATYQRKK